MNKKKTYLKITLWTVVVLWMILIFSFSAQKASQSASLSGETILTVARILVPNFANMEISQQQVLISSLQYFVRKVAHFLIYTVLGGLSILALFQHSMKMSRRIITAVSICAIYAVSDELHQLFVEGRACQIGDVGIDTCGALIGIVLVMLVFFIIKRNNKKKHFFLQLFG